MVFFALPIFSACSDDEDDIEELLTDSTSSSDDDTSSDTSDADDDNSESSKDEETPSESSDDDDSNSNSDESTSSGSSDDDGDDPSGSSDDDTSSGSSVDVSYTGTHEGYDYVDLGLSVKWATTNVGAESPEDYGNYYAWGETETKSEYHSLNSVTWGDTSVINIAGNASYDAATANWGGSWRMPTYDEMQELINECTWTWTVQNSVSGVLIVGVNSNSIFLPAAGYLISEGYYDGNGEMVWQAAESVGVGVHGDYWSSICLFYNAYYSYGLVFGNGYHLMTNEGSSRKDRGCTIRPILE